jgi:hypothetical protein
VKAQVLALQIMDCRIKITGLDASLTERVRDLFLAFPAVNGGEANARIAVDISTHGWRVHSVDKHDITGSGHNDLQIAIGTAVNAAVLQQTRHLAIHAGLVAFGDGAVAFPAESGSGKSTLTAACIQQGMAYLSDEALCIAADDALAVPYPKPLTLSALSLDLLSVDIPKARPAGGSTATERILSPAEIGAALVDVSQKFHVRHVVIPVRGSHSTRLVELPASTTVTELLRHSFNAYVEPRRAVQTAVRVAREAGCWQLHYGDARSAASLLARELGGH